MADPAEYLVVSRHARKKKKGPPCKPASNKRPGAKCDGLTVPPKRTRPSRCW